MRAIGRRIAFVARDFAATSLLSGDLDAAALARKTIPQDDSALRWSPVGSGVTTDANVALKRLFERLVRHNDDRGLRRRVDQEIWGPVRELLANGMCTFRSSRKWWRVRSAASS